MDVHYLISSIKDSINKELEMKKFFVNSILLSVLFMTIISAQESEEIRLLIQGDDIGMSHSINEACIAAYQDGVMRTVEIMVPCPWYPEAVKLLIENPGLEVGLHLVLTSEWEAYKWRPLTDAPSIVDQNGYFFPMTWPNKNYPDSVALLNVNWDSEELETELRAQIDQAMKDLPRINHLSSHMYVSNSSPEFGEIFEKLANEYNLRLIGDFNVERIPFGGKEKSPAEKEEELLRIVEELEPGTWMLVDHPGFDNPEMRALTHKGYENVAADRAGVTVAFSSEKVRELIIRRGIKLITYQDLLDEEKYAGEALFE